MAIGGHCEYTQAWSACDKGDFRAYLPATAIAKYSMRAQDGIERCSDVFVVAAGFGVNRRAFYRYGWCLCRMCLAHPLLMSPGCLRRADMGGLPIQAVRLGSQVFGISGGRVIARGDC